MRDSDATGLRDRAVYDVLLRSLALCELGEPLELAHVRADVDAALAAHDFIALRRALLEESATALVMIKRLPNRPRATTAGATVRAASQPPLPRRTHR